MKRKVFGPTGPLYLDSDEKDGGRVKCSPKKGKERRYSSLRRVERFLSGGIADFVVKDSMKQKKKKTDSLGWPNYSGHPGLMRVDIRRYSSVIEDEISATIPYRYSLQLVFHEGK
jgi:hypothetical protein